jgi:hypothetical protein
MVIWDFWLATKQPLRRDDRFQGNLIFKLPRLLLPSALA